MIAQKKSLRKITMGTAVVAMTIGLISTFSLDANAATGSGVRNYSGVGEDGQQYCFCNMVGQGCKCP